MLTETMLVLREMEVLCDASKEYFSSILAMGDRSAISLYEVPIELSLLGLGIGMIFAVFQILGIVLEFTAMFQICVR